MRKKKKILWAEMSRPELTDAVRNDALVILPVGSVEQHALHLPVGTDTLIVTEMAKRVGEKLIDEDIETCVTYPIWTGMSSHHMDFVGTITLDFHSFSALITQVCNSIFKHGFKHLAILNSHGGNYAPLEVICSEIANPIVVVNYLVFAREKMNAILKTTGRHAGELETSMIWSLFPHLVDDTRFSRTERQTKSDYLRDDRVYLYRTHKQRSDTGVIGDATLAGKEKGDQLWNIVIDELVNFFKEYRTWDLDHLERL